MARHPGKQPRTDTRRIGKRDTGELDAARSRPGAGRRAGEKKSPTEVARQRLAQDRDAAVEQLRRLGLSPEAAETTPRIPDSVLDEGDQAQASERQDLAYATRERLAARINRLTAALERLDTGSYGQCVVCGAPIEPARLAALPEADTCLRCQEQREQMEAQPAA